MIFMILSAIGAVVGLIGWFMMKSVNLLLIGFALSWVEKFAEWKNYNAGARKTEILIFVIGCAVGAYTRVPFWVGGMIASLIYDVLISLFSVIVLVATGASIKSK